MAWTTPRTWTTGEIVTAALLNAQIKANMDLTAPAIMTTLGDIIYCSAANTPSRLAKDTNSSRVLTNTGTSNIPAWAQVTLTTGVTGTLPVANGGTGITSLGSNVATFLGTPSSANLRSALTDETGTGGAVFATSPTLVTPALGTPGSGVLTSCTGLPEAGLAVSNSPTNGYMLTAQSGDAGGMTWAAAAGGGLKFIGTVEASNSATITVTGLDTSVYEQFMVIFTDLLPATDGDQPWIRFGDSGGVDSGASDYSNTSSRLQGASETYIRDDSDAQIRIGPASIEEMSAVGWVLVGNLTNKTPIVGQGMTAQSDGRTELFGFAGSRLTNLTLTQIQFLFSTGNITSGRMTVYGIVVA